MRPAHHPLLRPLALAGALVLALALCACGGTQAGMQAASTEAARTNVASSTASNTTSSTSTSTGDTQTVGSAELGYAEIPADWVTFVDVEGVSGLQYSDTSGTSILTLDLFDLSTVPEDQREAFDAEAAAQSVYTNLLSNDVENIEGAQQTLAGRDAYQLYGTYVIDDATTGFIICWLLEDDAGNIHYVCIEGPEDSIYENFQLIEDSYRLS